MFKDRQLREDLPEIVTTVVLALWDRKAEEAEGKLEAKLADHEVRIAAIETWKNAPHEATTGQEEPSEEFATLNDAIANLAGMVTALQSKLHEPGLWSRLGELESRIDSRPTTELVGQAIGIAVASLLDSEMNIKRDLCEQGKMIEDHGIKLRSTPENLASKLIEWLEITTEAQKQCDAVRADFEALLSVLRAQKIAQRVEHPAVAAVPAVPSYSRIERIPK